MKITNRTYIATILVLLCTTVALFYALAFSSSVAPPTQDETAESNQPLYQWRLVTTWPKEFPGLGMAPENFANLVNRMSNGRIEIQVFGAGEIVGALEVFDTVSSGAAEMGHGAAYYWKGKSQAAQFFTSVPFGMTAQEYNGWLHYGGGLELWRDIYQRFNLVPFAGGNTGVQMGGWYKREINQIEDLQGLKIRMPGLGGEVINRAGGTTVNIPGGELYTSLKTGVIDATEWVGPYNDLAFGFYEVADYYYYPGFHEPGASLEFIINQDVWNELPSDLQAIIEGAARAINQDMLDEYTARNNAALEELVNEHGVQLRRMPPEVFQHLKTISFELYDEISAQDEEFANVWQSYRRFLEGVENYHSISEEAYYEERRGR
ncbi:MAG: TRAP transporter substrate-binding protein [Gammaproteobacteria bacterium]|nr:TRAP transporter substrate-binding protein [Gammaproteobacteria bacterium]